MFKQSRTSMNNMKNRRQTYLGTTRRFEQAAAGKGKGKQIGPLFFFENDFIGKGAFSQVYSGLWNSVAVAIKRVRLSSLIPQSAQLLYNQILLLSKLNHPNLLSMLDCVYTQNNCYLVFELCRGGSLSHRISCADLTLLQVFDVFFYVLRGYLELVKLQVVHRDIKPDNILLDGKEAKLADMGFAAAAFLYSDPKVCVGTESYMAPQTYLRNEFNEKSDIWSVGISLLHCLIGQLPILEPTQFNIQDFDLLNGFGPRIFELINRCTKFDPAERPSAAQLLQEIQVVRQQLRLQEAVKYSRPFVTARTSRNQDLQINIKTRQYLKELQQQPRQIDFTPLGPRGNTRQKDFKPVSPRGDSHQKDFTPSNPRGNIKVEKQMYPRSHRKRDYQDDEYAARQNQRQPSISFSEGPQPQTALMPNLGRVAIDSYDLELFCEQVWKLIRELEYEQVALELTLKEMLVPLFSRAVNRLPATARQLEMSEAASNLAKEFGVKKETLDKGEHALLQSLLSRAERCHGVSESLFAAISVIYEGGRSLLPA